MDIQRLETQYLKAKIAYYDGEPIMSDVVFDALEQELICFGSKVVNQVGSKRKDFDFPHPTPMKSLAKFQTASEKGVTDYQENEFMTWLNKRINLLKNQYGHEIDHMYYSPKFDGSAINIVYRNGRLESVLTRGDGETGKDVTDRFRTHLPELLDDPFYTQMPDSLIQIRCEAVMRKSVFEKKYAEKFANARNLVAGIIGKDDIDIEMVADITLVPIHYIANGQHVRIQFVNKALGNAPIFGNPQSVMIRPTVEDYLHSVKFMEKERDNFEYPLDGIVFALPVSVREILGENDHDPEWSIAIKFVPDEVVTPVIGVQWNLGKTGEMTPVVCLKPVTLAGTTVKRASGYNAGYIVNNKIGEGAFVTIAKAGDIIPEVQKIHNPALHEEMLPEVCPVCGEHLKFDGIHLMCINDNCKGKTAKKLAVACGMLDLKGIGGKTIEPFAEDYNNMFELFVAVLNGTYRKEFDIEKYGIKYNSRSHQIFQDAFLNVKSLTFAQVILMMGYDGVGRKLADQVAKDYCGVEPDYKGHEKALVEMFKDENVKNYILNAVSVLESRGITIDKPINKNNMNTIYVCMTGSPRDFGFKTKEEFISRFPNVEQVSVTDARCNYLITDSLNSTSSKMKNAQKKGVKIVTYGEFKA